MNEEKEMTAEEKEQKSKKMDEVFDTTSDMILKDVEKIVGRDLTEDEKKSVMDSLKAFFAITSLMMCVTVR